MGIKQKRLRTFFIQYLLILCVGVLLLAAAFLGLFQLLVSSGVIHQANHTETLIQQARSNLLTAPQVNEALIPDGARFALYTKSGEYKSGTIPAMQAQEVWRKARDSGNFCGMNGGCFRILERADDICILTYSMLPQFSSSTLRSVLPNPQTALMLLFIILLLLEIVLLSGFFARRLNGRMASLKQVADKIQNRDLDFSVHYSGVKEIDDILNSLDQMRAELKKSLEEQWKQEQSKKQQIAALAHDIKTPVTIIKGNTELLADSDLTEEQRDYTEYIERNIHQIEKYMELLLNISKTENEVSLRLARTDADGFFSTLRHQTTALAAVKGMEVVFEIQTGLPSLWLDSELFYRAVMNVIANAVDYAPAGSPLLVEVQCLENTLQITVTDSGEGFSGEDLRSALKQFYRGDGSRPSGNHYGMGLYIADTIVRQHHGSLHIANSALTGGGEVKIGIPLRLPQE